MYEGHCDKCGKSLGEFTGEISGVMGPDKEDDTEDYLYELCKTCAEYYDQSIERLKLNFLVDWLNIDTPHLSQL